MKAVPPVAPGLSLLTVISADKLPGVVGVVRFEIAMLALPPLHTTAAVLTTDALGVGSTCTVVFTGNPFAQPAIFGNAF